jgi:hypothetical protein
MGESGKNSSPFSISIFGPPLTNPSPGSLYLLALFSFQRACAFRKAKPRQGGAAKRGRQKGKRSWVSLKIQSKYNADFVRVYGEWDRKRGARSKERE